MTQDTQIYSISGGEDNDAKLDRVIKLLKELHILMDKTQLDVDRRDAVTKSLEKLATGLENGSKDLPKRGDDIKERVKLKIWMKAFTTAIAVIAVMLLVIAIIFTISKATKQEDG